MAETIESFVAKLQSEGVKAGEDAARRIRGEAEREAEAIAERARQQAATVVADAERQASEIVARGKTQLDLAARDTALRLRDALNRALGAVVARGSEARLKDTGFLKDLLRDLVLLYAQRDAVGGTDIKVNIAPEVRAVLADWAMGELRSGPGAATGVSLDLTSTLKQAGFEYTVDGATIEVTLASVAAMLSELVGPELRATIDRALAESAQ
jgi:vacuolar-type H+-ATPase subunit E/Vma4